MTCPENNVAGSKHTGAFTDTTGETAGSYIKVLP